MRIKDEIITMPVQVLAIRNIWPHLRLIKKNPYTWLGEFRPFDWADSFSYIIEYTSPKSPKAKVVDPEIIYHLGLPHLFEDSSLCLYDLRDPLENQWTKNRLIAKTIIPWTHGWITFYAIWLKTGKWYGPEVPHTGAKLA
ncbi:MAG: hypothetical protein JXB38_19605 [Anaerolineales bacterium]|nr:hypothetical protein [Anaerolineales bacterium]